MIKKKIVVFKEDTHVGIFFLGVLLMKYFNNVCLIGFNGWR